MAIKIGTDSDGYTTYTNDPEQLKKLSKNEKPLTTEDVENIVLSFLSSVGIEITDNAVTISKPLLIQNELEPENYLPVVLSDAGIRRINLLSGFPSDLLVRGKFGTNTQTDKLITLKSTT